MEENKELHKLYTYIPGGNEILNYDDLLVVINGEKYKYKYQGFDLFDRGDKLTLTDLDGNVLNEENDIALEEIEDFEDIDRLKEILRIRNKMRLLIGSHVEIEDNIKRAYSKPEFIKEPKEVSKPNKKELDSVFKHLKNGYLKGLIPLFILLFFFLGSFIYFEEGKANKIITLVLGILTAIYLSGFLFVFIFDYITSRQEDFKHWQSNYNKYLEDREKYIEYEGEFSKYKTENDRIHETILRLDIRVNKTIRETVEILKNKLNCLTDGFINDSQFSITDLNNIVEIMDDEDIDFIDEALDRFEEIYVEDEDDDYEDETECYIQDGSIGQNEMDKEIVELLKEQNRLLEEQQEEAKKNEFLERMKRLQEESRKRTERQSEHFRKQQDEKEMKENIRSQCATCGNKPCANAYKTPNCPRYIWSGSKK